MTGVSVSHFYQTSWWNNDKKSNFIVSWQNIIGTYSNLKSLGVMRCKHVTSVALKTFHRPSRRPFGVTVTWLTESLHQLIIYTFTVTSGSLISRLFWIKYVFSPSFNDHAVLKMVTAGKSDFVWMQRSLTAQSIKAMQLNKQKKQRLCSETVEQLLNKTSVHPTLDYFMQELLFLHQTTTSLLKRKCLTARLEIIDWPGKNSHRSLFVLCWNTFSLDCGARLLKSHAPLTALRQ